MRVVVSGYRYLTDKALVESTLEQFNITMLIEGGATGADQLARNWARQRGIPVMEYFAEWNRFGSGAGPIRNQRMLVEGRPDLLIAFLAPGSRGTKNMIEQAQKRGLKTHIVKVEENPLVITTNWKGLGK
jgi:hypothetical protein